MTLDETRLARWVHRTLAAGVAASALLLVAGLGVVLLQNEPRAAHSPEPGAILHGVVAGDGVALLWLGLLVLIATPMLRVAVLAVGWLVLGPRWLAAVAFAVLALLALGVVLGLSG